MLQIYCEVKIGDPKGEKTKAQRMLVDTGSTYVSIPYQLAKELNLPFIAKTKVTLADGREIEADYSAAYIEINGRGAPMQVMVFDIMEPVIGNFALEALGLAIDPVSGELKPTRSYITRA